MQVPEESHLRNLARRLLTGGGLAYLVGVLGLALARPAFGPRHGWLELADDFEPWAYLPAPVLAVAGVLLRSRGPSLIGVLSCLVFGLRWGTRYLRARPGPTQ